MEMNPLIDKRFIAIVLATGLIAWVSIGFILGQEDKDKLIQEMKEKELASKELGSKEPVWGQVQSTNYALTTEPGQLQPLPYVKIISRGTEIPCETTKDPNEPYFCPIISFSYQVSNPFVITKKIDKRSPQLLRAMTQNEPIELEMRLYRIEPDGSEQHYFTLELAGAAVKGLKQYRTTNPDSSSWSDLEDVTFTYQQIRWTYEPDGIEHIAQFSMG
jgi:Type VI secretion system effector, Hcp